MRKLLGHWAEESLEFPCELCDLTFYGEGGGGLAQIFPSSWESGAGIKLVVQSLPWPQGLVSWCFLLHPLQKEGSNKQTETEK